MEERANGVKESRNTVATVHVILSGNKSAMPQGYLNLKTAKWSNKLRQRLIHLQSVSFCGVHSAEMDAALYLSLSFSNTHTDIAK